MDISLRVSLTSSTRRTLFCAIKASTSALSAWCFLRRASSCYPSIRLPATVAPTANTLSTCHWPYHRKQAPMS
jgi:hypothetical protein